MTSTDTKITRSQGNGAAKKTLAAIALERLRDDVIKCRLKPGDKLTFDDLKGRYGISISPLREALSRMASEGLVVLEDKRGFHVAPVSVSDLVDLARLRRHLECLALKESIERGDDEWEASIVATFHLQSKYDTQDNDGPAIMNEEWARRHREFHLALIASCGSPRLLELINSLNDHSDRYSRLAHVAQSAPRDSIGEHRDIMDAALARDAERAGGLLEQHFLKTTEIIMSAPHVLEEYEAEAIQ